MSVLKSPRFWIPPVLVAVCALVVNSGARDARAGSESAMAKAAAAWSASLGPDLRKQAVFPFGSDERKNWHYFPKARLGVSTKMMNLEQRAAAFELLNSALSSQGYLKVTSVIALEAALQQMEINRGRSGDGRDPELFFFSLFGDPATNDPWGWRVEGHHLSLNFSSITDTLIASTPLFIGANPALVTVGPQMGMRVLAEETDLALQLLHSFDEAQLAKVMIAEKAPGDIVLGPGRKPDLGEPKGIALGEMNPAQAEMAWNLVVLYATNLKRGLAEREIDRALESRDAIHFAWAGAKSKEKRHYYRLHGPTFIVEYDATQGGTPGHIHTLWRDPKGDFGEDLLRQHRKAVKH